MSFNDVLADSIKKMALVGDDDAKQSLKNDANGKTIDEWKTGLKFKVAGVGGLTGVVGGPVGLLLEGADIAYLLAACGQACYGVGHIRGREIDYDLDIPMILAIWSGAAEAATYNVVGKTAIKVGGKVSIKVGAKVGSKLLAKVVPKVGAKLAAKAASKISTKWIPIIGGLVSAGINYWVADGLIEAADRYYLNDYVVVDEDLSDLFKTSFDTARDLAFAD